MLTWRQRERRRRNIIRASAAAALAALLLLLFFLDLYWRPLDTLFASQKAPSLPAMEAGELRVHFLDVGQGDCTLIQFPDGKAMMVDGGDGSADAYIGEYCRAVGVQKFDCVLLTHPDDDHAAGLSSVLRTFGADTVWAPYFPASYNEAFGSFLGEAAACGANVRISQLYEHILSDSRENFYYAMILSPLSPSIEGSYYTQANAEGASSQDVNDSSAVLYLEYAGRKLLLSGDASTAVENALVTDYTQTGGEIFSFEAETAWGRQKLLPDLADIDFLKVPHHGGAGSTGEALLSLCRPRLYFISCGRGNGYFHPSSDTLARIRAAVPEAEFFRTDELGSVCLSIAADGGVTVMTGRGVNLYHGD